MSDAATTPVSAAASIGLLTRLVPYGVWIAAAFLLIMLPLVLHSGTALTVMSLMGISIIFT